MVAVEILQKTVSLETLLFICTLYIWMKPSVFLAVLGLCNALFVLNPKLLCWVLNELVYPTHMSITFLSWCIIVHVFTD